MSERAIDALVADIQQCGYFPDLVIDTMRVSLGDEPLRDYVVHHEATFSREAVQRHLTVLALTNRRLLIGHTDETAEPGVEETRAASTSESVPLGRINAVALTRVVSTPEHWRGDTRGQRQLAEAWLTLGWGTMTRVDLEPASCADPTCDADHGYSGQAVSDDLTVRVSAAADGPAAVSQLVRFGVALQHATGRA